MNRKNLIRRFVSFDRDGHDVPMYNTTTFVTKPYLSIGQWILKIKLQCHENAIKGYVSLGDVGFRSGPGCDGNAG